jgi:hypothetical protein
MNFLTSINEKVRTTQVVSIQSAVFFYGALSSFFIVLIGSSSSLLKCLTSVPSPYIDITHRLCYRKPISFAHHPWYSSSYSLDPQCLPSSFLVHIHYSIHPAPTCTPYAISRGNEPYGLSCRSDPDLLAQYCVPSPRALAVLYMKYSADRAHLGEVLQTALCYFETLRTKVPELLRSPCVLSTPSINMPSHNSRYSMARN